MTLRRWSPDDVRALGVSTDVVTAGAVLGIGRDKARQLARAGDFPCPVIRHGAHYTVPVAGLLRVLGLGDPAATPPLQIVRDTA